MRITIITQIVNTGTETKDFLLQTRCGLFLLLLCIMHTSMIVNHWLSFNLNKNVTSGTHRKSFLVHVN